MKRMIPLCLFFIINISHAAIYSYTDNDGNILYSDSPNQSDAKIIVMPKAGQDESSVVSSSSSLPSSPLDSVMPIVAEQHAYTDFQIISPKNNETIQNADVIQVNVDVKPTLNDGDKVQLMLDNKPVGSAVAGTSLSFSLADRGTHQLSAVILDANQQVVKSTTSITIYIHRVTINSPARVN